MVGHVEEAHAALHKAALAGAHVLHRRDRLQCRLPGLAVLEHSPSLLQVSTQRIRLLLHRGSHIFFSPIGLLSLPVRQSFSLHLDRVQALLRGCNVVSGTSIEQ